MTIIVNARDRLCADNGQPDSRGNKANVTVSDTLAEDLTSASELITTCPIDGMRLRPRQCKLICQVCGYYLGCSDYY